MLDKKRKKKNNVQKIHFQNVWHVLFLFLLCYLDSHLRSCASRPFFKTKGGGHKESYGELSIFFFFYFFLLSFSLRWSVCPLLMQERITGLHFFLFSSSVSRLSKKSISERCTVVRSACCLGVSAHQSSQLFI